ncbi:5-methylcytosine restriction system specificity protein McrC [Cupriavidus alkaliphilus]|uniref:5-methylcytosine restriction system specificity protein McrC n=1 Tax=Cupriavidus alkaliphilus TaxID=942866 RepID=UPI00160E9053|nr:5-methylcytosine-specific restriction enzyme subunit McrC [Cupriavidus alkaliphilus]
MQIVKVKEYGEVEIPADLISPSGELAAFPEILQKDYFSVRFKKGKPVFQAGGYIGLIPVNESLSLDISSKVPISNLARILLIGNHFATPLRRAIRTYGHSTYAPRSIIEFLVDGFINLMEEVHSKGLLRLYEREHQTGLFPHGRIDINGTVRTRAKTGSKQVHYSWSERNPDNGPNRLFKFVLQRILGNLHLPLHRKLRERCTLALSHFDHVALDPTQAFLHDTFISDPLTLPSTKDLYIQGISLAKLILTGKGIEIASHDGNIALGSLIVNLDDAFERYILEILRRHAAGVANMFVLDGNKGGADGGMKSLLGPSSRDCYIGHSIDANPDIVVSRERDVTTSINIVIDVKYKAVKHLIDRADLNQIISYAASYHSRHGLIVLPAITAESAGLKCLGVIGDTAFFQYAVNLNSSNMEEEEKKLYETVSNLLNAAD